MGARSVFCAEAVWAVDLGVGELYRDVSTEAASVLTPHEEPLSRRTLAASSRSFSSVSINAVPPFPPPSSLNRDRSTMLPKYRLISNVTAGPPSHTNTDPLEELMESASGSAQASISDKLPWLLLPLENKRDPNFTSYYHDSEARNIRQPSSVKLFRRVLTWRGKLGS